MEPPMFTTLRFDPKYFTDEKFSALKESLQQNYSEKGFDGLVEMIYHPVLHDLLVMRNYKSHISRESDQENYIVVDDLCGAAILRGANCFAPGILCLSPGAKLNELVNVYADLEGKCLKGSKQYLGLKYFVGAGILLVERNSIFSTSSLAGGVGVAMTRPLIIAPSLTASDVQFGFQIYPQNLPSVVCGHVLDVECPDDERLNVLDMCAGPGGKLSHLAQLMSPNSRATLFAMEKSANRFEKTRELLESFGYAGRVKLYHFDATKACHSYGEKSSLLMGPPPFAPEMFQRILLDAPCSGTGQRPLLVNRLSHNQMNSFFKVQRKLFKTAVDLLDIGGIFVYSTCSINESENEEIVKWALKTFKGILHLDDQKPNIRPFYIDENCVALQKFHSKFLPDNICSEPYDCDTIGFFIAKFKKIASTRNS